MHLQHGIHTPLTKLTNLTRSNAEQHILSATICYRDKTPGCVTAMVKSLGWEPLMERRKSHRLINDVYGNAWLSLYSGIIIYCPDEWLQNQRCQQTDTTSHQDSNIQTILLPTYHTRMELASECGNKYHYKTGGVQGQSTLRDGLATNIINATTRCI